MSLAVDLCVAKCHCTKCLTLYGTVFGGLLQLFNVHVTTLMLVLLVDFRVLLPRLLSFTVRSQCTVSYQVWLTLCAFFLHRYFAK